MLFSSNIFLFLFLPLVICGYFLIPHTARRLKNIELLIFSLFFYFFGEPKGIFLMLASILINYTFALYISKNKGNGKKVGLIIAICADIGLLCYYKYTGFIIGNINSLFSSAINIPDIIMPIGISFFTFQGMSYVIDVYRGQVAAQKNITNVAMYISLFPQLIAGPIVRYNTIERELVDRCETVDKVANGLRRFIYGLSKKLLLANTFGKIATDVFAMDYTSIPASTAWLGAVAFSLQIYFDFSGYSDMAIGLGQVFGFHFPENFNYPYISKSISEFWRRWHMSLSQWFRDYLYIPLGGSRKGKLRQIINILIVWSLTGLWHGASWNFVIWGMYFALILIAEKVFLNNILCKIPSVFCHIYSILLIIIGWVIFNCNSVAEIANYLQAMVGLNDVPVTPGNYLIYNILQYKWEWIFALLLSTPIFSCLSNRISCNDIGVVIKNIGTLLLFGACIIMLVNTSFNPFIYFRF